MRSPTSTTRSPTAPPSSDALPPGSERADIVGTHAWAAAGGPPLTLSQKLGQLHSALAAHLADLPGEIRWSLSSRGLIRAREVPAVGTQPLPETAAVEASVAQLDRFAEGEKEVVDHSHRTFHLADLLHRQSRGTGSLDREVLAVSMLLHDVGVFPKAVAELPGDEFTIRGAHLARRIAEDAGWSKHRADLVAQVITLNANGFVKPRWGAEAHFGRIAPIVDAAGQVWKIHPNDARELFQGRPLGDLEAILLRVVGAEAKRQPGGRFSVLRPMFPFLVRNCRKRWEKRLGSEVESASRSHGGRRIGD